jgi:tetratricopeptide (TPR) repeat protein
MTTRVTSWFALLAMAAAPLTGSAADPTLRFLEARVQQDPLDFTAHNRLAATYIKLMRATGDLGYLDRAAASARASLAAVPAPQNVGGLTALAITEFESHQFWEALRDGRLAYAIDPRDTLALAVIGDAELEMGDYAEAGETYDRLAQFDSGPPLLAREARLAEINGDDRRAIALLARAGDAVWYRVRLGEIYFRTGNPAAAETQYQAARRLDPDSYLALEHLAELRAAQTRYEEAIELYRSVIARVPRAEFLQALGDLYVFIGKPLEAKPWHDRALDAFLQSVEGGNAHYYHHLAAFYCDVRENPTEALKWARKDLEVRHSVYAYDTIAWALYKNGDSAGAAEAMERALTLGTQDPHFFYHAGLIFSRAGDLARGRVFFQQTVAVDPYYNAFHVHR